MKQRELKKSHILAMLFISLFFLGSYTKANLLKKWGFVSEGNIAKFFYDCQKGPPSHKSSPMILVSYKLQGMSLEHKTEWWPLGKNGYCKLDNSTKINITSIIAFWGDTKLTISASDYELENGEFHIVSFWFFFGISLFLLYVKVVTSNKKY